MPPEPEQGSYTRMPGWGLISCTMSRPELGLLPRASPDQVLPDDLLAPLLEHVGAALEEQHAEDVFLEFRGIHLAAQDVGCREEVPLKLRQGELAHRRLVFPFRSLP